MKNAILAVFTAYLVAGCTKYQYIPVEKEITVKETLHDTIIEVQVEREYVSQILPDTVSVVETKYAKAVATWHGNSATLEHTIENKAGGVEAQVKYVTRETVIEKTSPYPVETPIRMPLRWHEQALQLIGLVALIGGAVWAIAKRT